VRAIKANSLFSPKMYVAYAHRATVSSLNWGVTVSRIDVNGNEDPTWNAHNVSASMSDGGDGRDWPVGIEVLRPPSQGAFRDEVYVVAESARNCQGGVGVLHRDHDGNRVSSRVFGGDASTGPACDGNSRRFDRPQAIVANATNNFLSSARLAIVGFSGISLAAGPPTAATLTILDANLVTRDSRDFHFPVSSSFIFGDRWPALFGVVSDGAGTFAATGSLIYPGYATIPQALRGKGTVAVVRFAPNRIFDDGLE